MKRFLALSLCAVLLFLSACSGSDFSYVTSDMTEHFDLALDEITGGVYSIDLPPEVTEEDAWRQMRYFQLYYAKRNADNTDALDCYLGSPQFGDQAFIFYDVALSPDGDSVSTNLFSSFGAAGITLGFWEFPEKQESSYNPLLDNQALSDLLLQTTPATRVFEGVVQAGDVVVLDYDLLSSDNILLEDKTEVRIDTRDLSLYESIYPASLLSAIVGKNIGEEYSLTFESTVDGKATTQVIKYKVTHAVEEAWQSVAVDVPADWFSVDEHGAGLYSLNGKTVWVRFTLARYTDFIVPSLGTDFYINTLGLKTEETDPYAIERAAIEQSLFQLRQERLYQEVYPTVFEILLEKIFARDDRVKQFPKALVKTEYDLMVANVGRAYDTQKGKAESAGQAFPYANIDDFAESYYGYKSMGFKSYKDFCQAEAEYQVTLRLIVFTIAQLADLRVDMTAYEEYYKTALEYEMERYPYVALTEAEERLLDATYGDAVGDRAYAAFVLFMKKLYEASQGITLTDEDIALQFGTREKTFENTAFNQTKYFVLAYIYENNTWNDSTP